MKLINMFKSGFTCALVFQSLITCASGQDASPQEIGVVYYFDGSGFKALEKEAAPASGRSLGSPPRSKGHMLLCASQLEVRRDFACAASIRCGIDSTRLGLPKTRET